jgi:hypothetical protein
MRTGWLNWGVRLSPPPTEPLAQSRKALQAQTVRQRQLVDLRKQEANTAKQSRAGQRFVDVWQNPYSAPVIPCSARFSSLFFQFNSLFCCVGNLPSNPLEYMAFCRGF